MGVNQGSTLRGVLRTHLPILGGFVGWLSQETNHLKENMIELLLSHAII
jgi:hypothetical protein